MQRLFVPAFAAALVLAGPAPAAWADVSLPSVFGEDMVLQRGQPVPVWGKADPGEKVTVEVAGQKGEARADPKGRWRVTLEPLKAGGPHELKVRGKNEVTFTGVLVGEVWICSGQSNMQWPLSRTKNGAAAVAEANHPDIRLLTVPRRPREKPQDDFEGAWVACTPETARDFSAVAYYFGTELQGTLHVPIGLINSSFGGTPAEAWASAKGLGREPKLEPLLGRWEKAVANYDKKPGKRNTRLSPHRPSNLYNGMIHPLVPFAVKGAIWYQGESNAGRAVQYQTLFPALIRDWRARWGQEKFPFYFVQLANFMKRIDHPDDSAWAELREAQRLTLAEVPDTGMAVAIDIGEAKDIHPKNKEEVGGRLSLWALHGAYGMRGPFSGPLYREMVKRKGEIVVHFDHAGSQLQAHGGGPLMGFTIAGRDRKFVWADAKIAGTSVIVSSPEVKRPTAVRYAWADNPFCNLLSGAGLPASPFRTDDWPLTTFGKH